uniref:Uncharacterized protein n=1 Tax=Rhizophora mucronata TaxID=61149 RepID=A0A2P2IS69_RHIMU
MHIHLQIQENGTCIQQISGTYSICANCTTQTLQIDGMSNKNHLSIRKKIDEQCKKSDCRRQRHT